VQSVDGVCRVCGDPPGFQPDGLSAVHRTARSPTLRHPFLNLKKRSSSGVTAREEVQRDGVPYFPKSSPRSPRLRVKMRSL
jgi:hypothetical protein